MRNGKVLKINYNRRLEQLENASETMSYRSWAFRSSLCSFFSAHVILMIFHFISWGQSDDFLALGEIVSSPFSFFQLFLVQRSLLIRFMSRLSRACTFKSLWMTRWTIVKKKFTWATIPRVGFCLRVDRADEVVIKQLLRQASLSLHECVYVNTQITRVSQFWKKQQLKAALLYTVKRVFVVSESPDSTMSY